jgi:DNA-entry nuclease
MLVTVREDKPGFTSAQVKRAKTLNGGQGWIALSPLDSEGRARRAVSLIADNTLPTAARTALSYDPPGWHNKLVVIQGKKLWFYNRSHLIAFSLSGLNDVSRNLVTGAVKMNTPTMSNIEAAVARYVETTDNDVLYEVTPVYRGRDEVAHGLQIRYESVDMGKKDSTTLAGNYYLYNRSPGWTINYRTGAFRKAA